MSRRPTSLNAGERAKGLGAHLSIPDEPLIRHGRVYVFRLDNDIVGLVQYMLDWDHPKKAYMVGVSISKELRGQGIGVELLEESFEALSKEDIEEVELTVDPDNLAAVKLYESKLGFLVTDYKQDEYGEGERRLVMKLKLKLKLSDLSP